MSKQITKSGICPHCGKRFEAKQYVSVNVQISPELKKSVLDGTIFDVECPHCQTITKHVVPILYHDMEKGVMIKLDEVCDLILEEIDFKKMAEEYPLGVNQKFYGATGYVDFLNKVRFVESEIDPIYGQVILNKLKNIAVCKIKKGLKKEGINEEIEFAVALIELRDGVPYVVCLAETQNEQRALQRPFPVEDYKKLIEDEGYDMSVLDMDGKVFDEEACEHILDLEEDWELRIAVVHSEYGKELVEIPSFNRNKFKEGDFVLYMTADFSYQKGEILAIYDTMISKTPISYDKIGMMERRCEDLQEAVTTKGSNAQIDNVELLNKIRAKKEQNEVLPAVELRDAEVILGHDAQFEQEALTKALNDYAEKGEGVISSDYVFVKVHKTILDGKKFVNIYSCQAEVPADTTMKAVYKFDDVLSIVKTLCCDGIVIDPQSANPIVLTVKNLLEDYCPYNVMCDAKSMQKLLPILTEEEKEEIGEKELEYIVKVYLEGKGPKEIAAELGIDEKEVHKGLDRGYERMMWIVRLNYYNFATKKEETK